jgi:hypothetical protein
LERFNKTQEGAKMLEALKTQVGGTHYADMKIQPAEYILANEIGHYEAAAIEYISRWQQKGGLASLQKAQQSLQILIDYVAEQDTLRPDDGHAKTVGDAIAAEKRARQNAASKQIERQ